MQKTTFILFIFLCRRKHLYFVYSYAEEHINTLYILMHSCIYFVYYVWNKVDFLLAYQNLVYMIVLQHNVNMNTIIFQYLKLYQHVKT